MYVICTRKWSLGIAVSIVTRLRAGRQKNSISISGRRQIFIFSALFNPAPGLPTLLFNRYRV
jgi:hypothetical protein